MRILQLIDSLEIGGAEKMALCYANSLAHRISFSALVTTRKEGPLSTHIDPKVSYLYLNKKCALDLFALWRLQAFAVKHKITHVHAHSTSFFLAFLLKCCCPNVIVIRHDHYGNNEYLASRPRFLLKLTTVFFKGVIAVNQRLKKWSEVELKAKNVIYLPNFTSNEKLSSNHTILKGSNGKRIVLLANLRPQKNHFLLLEVAKKLKETHNDWSFHLVGKDLKDSYSEQLKNIVKVYALKDHVYFYDSRQDISNILEQVSIGILTSNSEGMPLALLEYGQASKPVVVTKVGEIPSIVEHEKNGFVVDSNQREIFYHFLVRLIEDQDLAVTFGKELNQTIGSSYSEEKVITTYLNWLTTLI